MTNGVANLAELGFLSTMLIELWRHPVATLTVALIVLVLLILLVRAVWRGVRRSLANFFSDGGAGPSSAGGT